MTKPVSDQRTRVESSRWEDFIDILYAPAAVFERRRDGGYGVPLLILTVLLAGLLYVNMVVLAPVYLFEMQRGLEAAGDQAVMADPGEMARMGQVFGVLGFAIFFPISVLFAALLLWLGARLLGAAIIYSSAALVATYSQVPSVFQQLAAILQGIVLDVDAMRSPRDVTLSLARFLPPETDPVLLALAGRLELFTLWSVALMAIGLAVIAKVPRSSALVVAIVVWLVGGVPELIGALLATR